MSGFVIAVPLLLEVWLGIVGLGHSLEKLVLVKQKTTLISMNFNMIYDTNSTAAIFLQCKIDQCIAVT